MLCSSPVDWPLQIWVAMLVVIAVALKGLSFHKKANKKASSLKPTTRLIRKTIYEHERL